MHTIPASTHGQSHTHAHPHAHTGAPAGHPHGNPHGHPHGNPHGHPHGPGPGNAPAEGGLMARLKTQTQPLHDAAEKHAFHHALATGQARREDYAAYLGQLLHVHAALDDALRAAARTNAVIGRVWRDEHHNVARIEQDLRTLGVDPARARAGEAARRCIDHIRAASVSEPVALLGFHYVMEGSKNGGKFIAKVVRRSMNLPGNDGTHYLDPYGDAQRALWGHFRADVDGSHVEPREQDAIVRAAEAMFAAVAQMGDDVLQGSVRV